MFTAPKTMEYHIDGDRIVVDGISPRAKLTGTGLGAILGQNPYMSPFAITSRMLGLYGENLDGNKYIEAGKTLEGVVLDYLAKTHPDVGTFLSADDVFAKRIGDHDSWVSDFADDTFAGHLDGVIVGSGGRDFVLEIKTTSRRNIERGMWAGGVPPEHYLWQAFLYNEFVCKANYVYFGLGILDEEHYKDPRSWIPSSQNCFLFRIPVDHKFVENGLERARALYNSTVGEGITAPVDRNNPRDMEIWNFITDMKKDDGGLTALSNQLYGAQEKMRVLKDQLAPMEKEAENLSARLKNVMVERNIGGIGNYKLSSYESKSFDWAKAKEDGLDVDAYTKKKMVYTLR